MPPQSDSVGNALLILRLRTVRRRFGPLDHPLPTVKPESQDAPGVTCFLPVPDLAQGFLRRPDELEEGHVLRADEDNLLWNGSDN